MRGLHLFLSIFLIIAIAAISLGPATQLARAQDDEPKTCEQFVPQILTDLGTNCADQEDGSVCYGSTKLERMFTDKTIADSVFSKAGDQVELTWLARVTSSAFNLREEEWGVSILNARANIHNALDETATYILFGDSEIENRVKPEDALLPVDFVAGATTADANVYRHADSGSEQLGTLAGGSMVEMDGVSPDGGWRRILFNDGETNYTAWIESAVVDPDIDVSTLPEIDRDTYTPMQDFFLRNGYNMPECKEAIAPVMLVQAPEATEVDIRVDDVDIRLHSTILLRVLPQGDTLEVIVLDGLATIFPDTDQELIIPPGHSAFACLTPPGDYGGLDEVDNDQVVGCPFSVPAPLTEDGAVALNLLSLLPGNILRYRIVIPIIIIISGVGGVIIIIDLPGWALRPVQRLCEQGVLPEEICERFEFPAP